MMQQLQIEFKNAPMNVDLVYGSASDSLNKDQSLSEDCTVLVCNDPEGHLPQYTGGLKVDCVYVLAKAGHPLMPCSNAKARKLLKQKKARVIKNYPFTIQLNFDCENQTQDITLGIDPGYENIGFSAITEKKELISGTIKLENGMTKRLIGKAMYRRGRRNRHHWYRKPRFMNRGGDKKGWLPPSVLRRLNTHVYLAKKLKEILPITKIVIEAANFDIQKLNNPEISGIGYQQGDLYNYKNMQSYLIAREYGKCQLCQKEYDKNGWHQHHIIPRSKGGTDKPSNMALLHLKCHEKLHKKGLYKQLKKNKQYKPETFMSTIRWKLTEEMRKICPNVKVTFGYITNIKRNETNIEKTHNNDAFVIAGGNNEHYRFKPYQINRVRCHNRLLERNKKKIGRCFKNKEKSRARIRYKYNSWDLVYIGNKQYVSGGMCSLGKYMYVSGYKEGDSNVLKSEKSKAKIRTKEITKHIIINNWHLIRTKENK